ncbi:hypothetical protein VQ056_15610 [Paenibacillus sp. JTLBN-2024]
MLKKCLEIWMREGKNSVSSSLEQAADIGQVADYCQLLGVSRSGYYAYLKRKNNDRDAEAKRLIHTVYKRYEGRYGYRQIQLFLWQDEGCMDEPQEGASPFMQKLGPSAQHSPETSI